jgi:hypothetical protein
MWYNTFRTYFTYSEAHGATPPRRPNIGAQNVLQISTRQPLPALAKDRQLEIDQTVFLPSTLARHVRRDDHADRESPHPDALEQWGSPALGGKDGMITWSNWGLSANRPLYTGEKPLLDLHSYQDPVTIAP